MNLKKYTLLIVVSFVASSLFSGNKDRIGQAGASQLQNNPWAKSTGFANANMASVKGLESVNYGIAGLAFVSKTELIFTHTRYFSGSGLGINAFGFAQKLGENGGVFSLNIMSLNFGDIDITTVDLPDGGSGTYSPQYINLSISYAREFSNSISAGFTFKSLSESVSNVTSRGIAFDAGIKYKTGEDDKFKFAVALRNIGPKMKYSGDGLSTKVQLDGKEFTLEQRSEPFELPSSLSIGVSYDLLFGSTEDAKNKTISAAHRVTIATHFLSNSFGKDNVSIGAEYSFQEMIMVRAGLNYENGIFNAKERSNSLTGPAFGITYSYPINDRGSSVDFDYSYRDTNPFNGHHTFGIRLNL